MTNPTEIFEHHRPKLFRLAYAMLRRTAPAEDAVQETYLRWRKQDYDQIQSPIAWLSKVLSRICLDEMKSARIQREQYIGPDLPEPFLAEKNSSPEKALELAESLSMALLVVLDRLTPVQQAVFLLREVFDYDYVSISEIINKSESHCRKIAQRARDQIHNNKPRFENNSVMQQKRVKEFVEAIKLRDIREIERMLAREAILYSDGGGKVTAARKPITRSDNIAKFLSGIQKGVTQSIRIEFTIINGEAGMITYLDEELYNVWSFHIENDKIHRIFVVLNPDKLEHIKRGGVSGIYYKVKFKKNS